MSRLHNAIDLLGKLVAFDTTSKNSNLGLIHFVRDYLAQYGIESTLFHDETGEKANLLATIGPKDVPGIALSGHTDVVPALEKSWISPAFELTERDGKLFGRGSADMKGFSACALAMVPELVKRDLAIPFHLCLSYDEEVGCLGVGSMVDHLANLKTPPRLAVIGEPTEMKVINGQKGKFSMRVAVTGTAGHSSFAPRHVNAIEYAARAITMISDLAREFEENGPFDNDFTVPHSTMLTTTIGGGTATNVTPDFCEFTFEIRHLPEHDAKAVLDGIKEKILETLDAEMKAKEAETGFEWEESFPIPEWVIARMQKRSSWFATSSRKFRARFLTVPKAGFSKSRAISRRSSAVLAVSNRPIRPMNSSKFRRSRNVWNSSRSSVIRL